jgi:hypothetical protein
MGEKSVGPRGPREVSQSAWEPKRSKPVSQHRSARELEDLRIESKESARENSDKFRPGRRSYQRTDRRRWTSQVASSGKSYVRVIGIVIVYDLSNKSFV